MSDLEAAIVDAFRANANGFSDRELAQQGRLYAQLPADARQNLFPARFAGHRRRRRLQASPSR